MSHDAQYASHPDCPYHTSSRDVNREQAAAESVAERLFLSRSPEFCSWIAGRMSDEDVANLVVAVASGNLDQTTIAKMTCRAVRGEFQEYVCSIPDELRAEIRREL